MTSKKTIPNELLDDLLKDYTGPQDLLGEGGLLKALTKHQAAPDAFVGGALGAFGVAIAW